MDGDLGLDVVLDCGRGKSKLFFKIGCFRISLMDKMVILSGNWIYAWRGGPEREREKKLKFPGGRERSGALLVIGNFTLKLRIFILFRGGGSYNLSLAGHSAAGLLVLNLQFNFSDDPSISYLKCKCII